MSHFDIDNLTLKQLREIASLMGGMGGVEPSSSSCLPFKAGDAILVRTVTMTLVGRVAAIGPDFITMEDGGWVAETARFSVTLTTGALNEFERAPSWFVVARGSIVDIFPWGHALPKTST